MTIDFRCPQCDKLLRVADDAGGARAKCPSCGSIAEVPRSDNADTGGGITPESPSDFDAFTADPEPKPQPAAGAANYFGELPSESYQPAGKPTYSGGEVIPTKAEVGDIISYAWEVWKQNLGLLIGCTAVIMVVGAVFGGVQAAAKEAGGQPAEVIVSFFHNLVQLFLGIGNATIVLKLVRGQPAEFSELFGGGRLYLRMLGASILVGLMVVGGTLLCIVPGIIVALLFWPYYYLIVDEKAGAIESLGQAVSLGRENVLTSFVLWLASIAFMLLGCAAVCIGILFAAPLVNTMWGTAYLMMSGEQLPKRP